MNNKTPGLNVGFSSVLVTFVLLCLITFATLSLVTVRSDCVLTDSSAERIDAYYKAYGESQELLSDIAVELSNYYYTLENSHAFYSEINTELADIIKGKALERNINAEDISITENEGKTILSYAVLYNNNAVYVSLEILYSDDLYDIISYKVISRDANTTVFSDDALLNPKLQ